MELLEECKLCGKSAVLQNSHIIPRSYYKRLKRESNQLVVIVDDAHTKPALSNSDPKEKLLCLECERYLSDKYESYGTKLFRSSRNVIQSKDFITINGFNYKRFYLYFVSILWRASISKNKNFSNVSLGPEIETLLKYCINNDRIKIGSGNSLKLDNFIRLSVVRIIDSTNHIADYVIKGIMLNFKFKEDKNNKSYVYYSILEGFLIFFTVLIDLDIHSARANRLSTQMVSGSSAKIMKVEITKDEELTNIFNLMIRNCKRNL
ncbi:MULTISPECIES: hypothetical protein [Yersinia]|uniref:HNH endonuclease n=1 Tax=Yersinia kristensenii TaxID=28152 RepID=A0A0T9M3X4_YERKR|nr:hypothetical protein [Yersinia kristensenii]MDA5491498.1 hypothetical protein [Yersinia kristensenii]CNF58517.1 Uncharacterised protein [Yersinia kristensenii]